MNPTVSPNPQSARLEGESSAPRTSRRWLIPVGIGVVAIAGLGVWWWSPPAPVPSAVAAVAAAPSATAPSQPATTDTASVPAMSPRSVSAHPSYLRWLDEPEAQSRAVAAIVQLADGESPASLLGFLRPAGSFQVEERGGRLVIADASFSRYDAIADVVDDVDAPKAVAAYRALRPALARVHAQVARPGATLDASVARALEHLLAAGTPPAEIVVVPGAGINYGFADSALEGQSAAQKHIVRMGAKNAQRVKAKLRAVQRALEQQ